MDLPPVDVIVAICTVVFLAIGLHEYAHCKMADLAGDPTPSFYGRVTLNLTKHFELVGTLMIILTSLTGFGIGWGKPSPCNDSKMKNPRWDGFACAAAGPVSNLIQAMIWALLFRISIQAIPGVISHVRFLQALMVYGVLINLSLCMFNLFPLGPLDGHWLVGYIMPEKPRFYWFRFNRSVGRIALIVVILLSQTIERNGGTSIFELVIGRPVTAGFGWLTGQSLDGSKDDNGQETNSQRNAADESEAAHR